MIEFKLPDLGEGISEAEIISWLVREGQTVAEHQGLLEVETDKAIVPVPSPAAGRVVRCHHAAGARVSVGDVLVSLEPVSQAAPSDEAPQSAQTNGHHQAEPAGVMAQNRAGAASVGALRHGDTSPPRGVAQEVSQTPPRGDNDLADSDAGSVVGQLAGAQPTESVGQREVLATPAVRRLARQLGIEIHEVAGSGLGHRITEADVRGHLRGHGASQLPVAPSPLSAPTPTPKADPAEASGTASPGIAGVTGTLVQTDLGPIEKRPLRGVRRAIAHHLSRAARLTVPVTNFDDADVTELVRIRAKQEKAARDHGVRLTYLPFIIKAVIQALKQFPTLNSILDDDNEEIIVRRYYNIGIAVDTPDGLMVPVIKNADRKNMLAIAGDIQHLAEAAYQRTLRLSDLRGGTFTITNIGAIGGTHATPITNHPETAILAVGRIKDRVVPYNGQPVIRKVVGLSLTFDHRVIDGGDAARFLNCVIQHIEDPDLILIKSSS